MSPTGKIININAFKNKESGLTSNQTLSNGKRKKNKKNTVFVISLVVSVAISLAMMMTPSSKKMKIPPVDSIIPYNIKAQEDMLIEDKESTEINRKQIFDAVLDVYDFDSAAEKKVNREITDVFSLMANAYTTYTGKAYKDVIAEVDRILADTEATSDSLDSNETAELERLAESKKIIAEFESGEEFPKLEQKFADQLGIQMSEKMRRLARHYYYSPEIGKLVAKLLGPLYAKGVVPRKSQLLASSVKGLDLRFLGSGAERVVRNFEQIYDVPEAISRIKEKAAEILPAARPGLKKLVIHIATGKIVPNITFNRKETELRKEKALEEAKPVFFQIKRGEMIVREGDRITPIHLKKLKHMASLKDDRGRLKMFVGLTLLNLLLLILSGFFVQKFHEDIRESPKLQLLLALLLVTHIGLIWASAHVFTMFLPQTPGIDLRTYMLAAPLAFGPMMVSIFFTTEVTVLFTVVCALLTGILLREFSVLSLLTMTSGLICAHQVRTYNNRSSVLKVGLYVSLVNVIGVLAFDMISSKTFSDSSMAGLPFAMLGGAVSALFVSGAVPLIESIFPVVSDFKLLELTNLNHPLLRRMMLEAPGTYQHSMMVGSLSEEACKTIGANALMARAGALFHDIGKMRKSEYFVENQMNNINPHDKLSPSMSTLILVNHIKEGIELAKQFKLLPQIAVMIPEHHGTQLVRYFYNKAKESEDVTRGEVKEADFKYPGPIPSSKESACVALADSIEAASRACVEPTPAKLRGVVTDVINDKFTQGQLDNSHLTLRDLALVTDSFTHVLMAIHHHRIRYPELSEDLTEKKRGRDAHRDTKTKETRDA
ncbi:Membrane protein containing HD superfamily hydrolase domain, YQFF ortholog [hydrothermal vent metagenome]|uniref:Membrane protein containing HD superfamily hydrolase domain, YQFF ortholog n=1 Tax=hydrothermal vent metagenome TaxID=652676 RepID=A0A3B1BEZ3_9ZZZZ